MKLVLVRHGESIWNKENLFTGWTDVELSENGKMEAAEAGKALKEAGYDYDMAAINHTEFTRKYTLASGNLVCDCHYCHHDV